MWCFLILSLTVSSYVGCSAIDPVSSVDEPWKNPYLPYTIEPTQYDLYIDPRYSHNQSVFFGNVTIYIKVLNRTKTVIVHAKDLEIKDRRVRYLNGNEISQEDQFDYSANDYYVMKMRNFMEVGNYKLTYGFQGNMTFVVDTPSKCSGLYTIPYEKDGGTSWLVVSDFNLNKARNVFPNFDEPRFKTPFKIMIRNWYDYEPLSNMPVESTVGDVTVFKLSPKMSSYQVVFSVSDFSFENKTDEGRLYRVWAPANQLLEKADYVLSVTPPLLKYLSEELNIEYPLQTIDQVAVPGKLLKCQENWPATDTIFNLRQNGDSGRYETIKLIAHTLAHSYFGNLVTCRFWEHVWLNEGLATFYEVRAVTSANEPLRYNDIVYGLKVEEVMNWEEMNFGRSLIHPFTSNRKYPLIPSVGSTDRDKGAAILRMIEHFMGADKFKSAIRRYLTSNANSTVVTADLWRALQAENGNSLNISQVMKDWTEKRGFPVINVTLLSGNRINATQEHLQRPGGFVPPNETYKWYVPLTFKQKGGSEKLVWMNRTDLVFQLSARSGSDWIVFNNEKVGHYRVNYDTNLRNLIAKQLMDDHKVFSELTRMSLLADALALVKSQQLGYDALLNLTKYAPREADSLPWFSVADGFDTFNVIRNTSDIRSLEGYILNVTKAQMDRLQVRDHGTYIDKQLRPKIMMLACSNGHRGCIDNTTRVFKAWIRDETANAVPEDYASQVYCLGLANSVDESDWNTTAARCKRATDRQQKIDLLEALSCTKKANLINRLLELTFDTTFVTGFDRNRIISGAAHHPDNLSWKWLKRSYNRIDQVYGNGTANSFLPFAVKKFNTEALKQEVLDFCNYTNVAQGETEFAASFMDVNIGWMDRNYNAVKNWIQQNH